jgi:hypothetical protein
VPSQSRILAAGFMEWSRPRPSTARVKCTGAPGCNWLCAPA